MRERRSSLPYVFLGILCYLLGIGIGYFVWVVGA